MLVLVNKEVVKEEPPTTSLQPEEPKPLRFNWGG